MIYPAISKQLDPNADDNPFTHETLTHYSKQCEELYGQILFGTEDPVNNPIAEQQYLQALSFLQLAQRSFAIASLQLRTK